VADPRAEAFERLGGRYEARVLEPSPPAVSEAPWLADDPTARGEISDGRALVGPTSAADITWDELCNGDPELSSWCAERWLGAWKRLDVPPPHFSSTRHALQALAEHVIAAARHKANGKIGLRYTRGGYGTPFFGDNEQLRVWRGKLVRQEGHRETIHEPATLGAAADVARIRCGAPEDVYRPTTALDPQMQLQVDAAASTYLGDLFGFGTAALEELRVRASEVESPSRVQLWPEHFDVAVELGDEESGQRAGYGVSPGDEAHDEPYLYVVPWGDCPTDPWWNATYFDGAVCELKELLVVPDQRAHALGFFEEGRRRLREG
jgi:hypothetical protein